jgi:hypothetical protein
MYMWDDFSNVYTAVKAKANMYYKGQSEQFKVLYSTPIKEQ